MSSANASLLGPLLGVGKEAEVYAWGDGRVAKRYRPGRRKATVFREAATTSLIESAGLPCPAVWGVLEIEQRWAVILDRAPGPTFAEAMRANPDLVPGLLAAMARLHRQIHAVSGLPLGRLRERLSRNIERAEPLAGGQRETLLARLAAMPDADSLCHGDFHPLNIMGEPGRETVLDWVDAALGDPAADVCRSSVLIRSVSAELAEAYVEAYVAMTDMDRARIEAWLPIVAGARLAEGVPHEAEALLALAAAT